MSPPRKKTKGEGVGRPDDSHSGVIRYEFAKGSSLSSLCDQFLRFSPSVQVGGVLWEACVCFDKTEAFACLYNMSNDSTPWSVDVDAEFILVHSDSSKNITEKESFDLSNNDYFFESFSMNWADIVKKGFVKDNKITFEIRFSISNLKGIRNSPSIDFTDPHEPCHDLALDLNGGKLFVSKQILAVNSSVFKAMFYGGFDEKGKKEIELKDVYREEFLEILRMIYHPFCKKITVDKMEYLLKLSDQFHINCVVNRLETFLIETGSVDTVHKLRIADAYRLKALMDDCLTTLKTTQDFKNVKESPMYGDLSPETVRALFDRCIATRK